MTISTMVLLPLALATVGMAGLCVVALRRRDLGLVDLGWTAGVGATALWYASQVTGAPWRRAAVAALTAAWATRLLHHMLAGIRQRQAEDGRYQALRAHWGNRINYYAPWLFVGQAPLIVLFALPVAIAMRQPAAGLTPWDVAGFAIGILSIVGEAAADRQLTRFRAQPEHRGQTCRAGLWRYSRHPNYFFEWLHWWAYVLIAVGAPQAWLTWMAPTLMLLFLFKVTGIPHAERQALASRGDDYRRYQAVTSVFIPWFPRRERAR